MIILKKIGRSFVLPTKEIENVVDTFYKKYENKNPILDFGSGTLFWSEKFCYKYGRDVFAIDPLYNKKQLVVRNSKIHIFDNMERLSDITNFSMIFTCDVLHHIDKDKLNLVLKTFIEKSNLIVIKDIEASDFWGNIQNKIHDLILNRQLVNNIYSEELEAFLNEHGYNVHIYKMKKLGYPHFLLIAYR